MKRRSLILAALVLLLSFSAGKPAHADISSGLVGYWNFDEGSGTIAADSSGSNNNGTLTNGPAWVAGKIGSGALQFNGTNAYVNIPSNSAFAFPNGITVSAWIYDTKVLADTRQGILENSDGGILLDYVSSSGLHWGTLNATPPQNSWQHVVATADSNGYRLYVNGVLADSNATPFSGVAQAGLKIGFWEYGAYFGGSLDDVRIYTRALSASDVSELYAYTGGSSGSGGGTVTPPVTPPASDTTAPIISSVASGSVTSSGATISWTTDESSDSQIEYGLTTGYGNSTSLNSSLATFHSVPVSGLTASTLYHYRVKSKDSSGNLATGSDNAFTTGAAAVTPPVTDPTPPVTPPVTPPGSLSANLPSDRVIDWTRNMALNYTIPNYAEVACTPTDSTGATDMSAQIQACLTNAPINKAVKLPAGRYRIDSSVNVPTGKALRGSGPSQTKILLHNAGTSLTIENPSYPGGSAAMKPGASNWTKGSQTISVVASQGTLSVGDFVNIKERNLSYCNNSNCNYSGTHTGSTGASVLADSAASWTAGQWVGYKIEDSGSMAIGTITANTANTITAALVPYSDPAGRTTWNSGDQYRIYPANNTYAVPTLIRYNYNDYEMSQYAQITSKSADLGGYFNLGLSIPLNVTYDQSMAPVAVRAEFGAASGIESLYVEKTDNVSGSIIYLGNTRNCWVKNVETYKTYNYHIMLNGAFGCIIRDNYMHESWQYGGNAAYGVAAFSGTSNNLIENNIFYHDRHSLELEIGPNANIFGYNYSKDPIETLPVDWLTFDLAVHGGDDNMNLFEGNIVASIGSDYATGGDKYNTFFRNWATRNHTLIAQTYFAQAANIQRENLYTNMIGNIFNTPGVTSPHASTMNFGNNQSGEDPPDSRSLSTAYMCGNYDQYAGTYDINNSACSGSIPNSLYLSGKPSWFGSLAWPAVGPDVSGRTNKIPAQVCFENNNLATGGSFDANSCYYGGGGGGGIVTPPVTPPADTTAPSVSITSPSAGTISGSVSLAASASDDTGVAGVQFKLDGTNLGTELTAAPYSGTWNTVGVSNGSHTLTAVARDAAGNTKTSSSVTVTVSNSMADTSAPSTPTGITSSSLTQTRVTLSWLASIDNVGVSGYKLFKNGTLIASPLTNTYAVSGLTANTLYTFTVSAYDAAGNTSSLSLPLSITTAANPVTTYTVSVSKSGTGSGTISGAGISCGSTCSASVTSGTSITLTATPNSDSTFDGWSGACTNSSGPCVTTVISAKSVSAVFTLLPVTTPVTPPASGGGGGGGGSSSGGGVISSPTGTFTPTVPQSPIISVPIKGTGIILTKNLYRGITDSQVTTLQTYLISQGYLGGTATGYFGPLTEAGVMRYQAAHGISQTGTIGPITRASLAGGSAVTTTPTTSGSIPAFTRSLTIGSTGSDVRYLQIFLNKHGFQVSLAGAGSPNNETTYFGPATARALGKFQAAKGISPSVGYFGPLTMKAVNSLR